MKILPENHHVSSSVVFRPMPIKYGTFAPGHVFKLVKDSERLPRLISVGSRSDSTSTSHRPSQARITRCFMVIRIGRSNGWQFYHQQLNISNFKLPLNRKNWNLPVGDFDWFTTGYWAGILVGRLSGRLCRTVYGMAHLDWIWHRLKTT